MHICGIVVARISTISEFKFMIITNIFKNQNSYAETALKPWYLDIFDYKPFFEKEIWFSLHLAFMFLHFFVFLTTFLQL